MPVPGSFDHHVAQRAIVRMLYDHGFADTVRRNPESSGLPAEVARRLGAIDPRALRADVHRRRRTLGVLVEELRASAVLALDECRSIALLDGFFASPEFHRAVELEAPLVFAFGDYLAASWRAGRLRADHLPDVIALEQLQARARRETAPVPERKPGARPLRMRLAPGVAYARLPVDVLDVVRRVDEVLFETSLVPGMALAIDGARLDLPARESAPPRLGLLVVPLAHGQSVVALDDDLCALIEPLAAAGAMDTADLVAEAVRRGVVRPRAEALLDELLDDEALCAAPGGAPAPNSG